MLFARYDRAAQRAQDRVYGRDFQHLPRVAAANVNAAMQADPARPARVLVGILVDAVAEETLSNIADARMNRRPGVAAREHRIEIADPHADMRRGDLLVEVASGARWLIEAVDRDDMGRRLCRVNAA